MVSGMTAFWTPDTCLARGTQRTHCKRNTFMVGNWTNRVYTCLYQGANSILKCIDLDQYDTIYQKYTETLLLSKIEYNFKRRHI